MTHDQARAALADAAAAMSDRLIVIGFKELSWTVAGHHLGVRPSVELVVEEAFRGGREDGLTSRLALPESAAQSPGGR